MTQPQILAFAGSARQDSINKKLVQVAAQGAQEAGAQVTYLDVRELPLPLYDQDLEDAQGLPENVLKLKALMRSHHGFLIACPEYNSSITPLLKNMIDWASRPEPGQQTGLDCFQGKVAVLMSASPGSLGGLRGLFHVRSILSSIGVIVLPDQKAVPNAFDAFDSQGNFTDDSQQQAVKQLGGKLTQILTKLI